MPCIEVSSHHKWVSCSPSNIFHKTSECFSLCTAFYIDCTKELGNVEPSKDSGNVAEADWLAESRDSRNESRRANSLLHL